MIDLFLLSGNTTTNNADNGSLQSSSNSKTKMTGGNTVIATGSGTISVTANQQLHTVAKISSNYPKVFLFFILDHIAGLGRV